MLGSEDSMNPGVPSLVPSTSPYPVPAMYWVLGKLNL